jgi:hypothetical protein
MTGGVISSRPRRPFGECPALPMLPEPCPRFSAVSSRRCTSCCGLQPRSRKRRRGPWPGGPRNVMTRGCKRGPSACSMATPTCKARWPTQSAHQQPPGRLLDARLSLPDLQDRSALAVRRRSDVGSRPGQPRTGRSRSHVQVAGGSLAGNDHSLIWSTVGRAQARWFSSTSSIALAGGGSPGCGSDMWISLILARRVRNGVTRPGSSLSPPASHPR